MVSDKERAEQELEWQEERKDRFKRALQEALIGPPAISQRDLSDLIGVKIGSLSKYLRKEVDPYKVNFQTQCLLAKRLGCSTDELHLYYRTGEWHSNLSLDDVTGWLRSQAVQEDLPAIMESLTATTMRVSGQGLASSEQPEPEKPEPYTWPVEALQEAGITDKWRERMGLGNDVLERLVKEGVFDDEAVEAFSIALKLEQKAVREAFENRAAA